MTHTKHRKRRARFIFQVERLYPALIEGRMARGHRAVGMLLPWSPKLHGWRDIGYFTDDGGLFDRVDRQFYQDLQQRAEDQLALPVLPRYLNLIEQPHNRRPR